MHPYFKIYRPLWRPLLLYYREYRCTNSLADSNRHFGRLSGANTIYSPYQFKVRRHRREPRSQFLLYRFAKPSFGQALGVEGGVVWKVEGLVIHLYCNCDRAKWLSALNTCGEFCYVDSFKSRLLLISYYVTIEANIHIDCYRGLLGQALSLVCVPFVWKYLNINVSS